MRNAWFRKYCEARSCYPERRPNFDQRLHVASNLQCLILSLSKLLIFGSISKQAYDYILSLPHHKHASFHTSTLPIIRIFRTYNLNSTVVP
jgi:hypothetical protein